MNNTLKIRLCEKGIKKKDFAKLIGVSSVTLSAYCLGLTEPKVSTAMKMAEILNCSVYEIFDMESESNEF